MKQREILRILDANFNRCREGLRVCEEIARFVMQDKSLTAGLKRTRHAVSDCLQTLPVSLGKLMASRDTLSDVGKNPSPLENKRKDALALFAANLERVKESLRVLEESSKLLDAALPAVFKKLRFKAYAIEKKALPKLETLRHHGPGHRR